MNHPKSTADWASGPAKWAAVLLLGSASLAAMAWSIFARQPRPLIVPGATAAPEQDRPPTDDARTDVPAGDPRGTAPPWSRAHEAGRSINLNTASAAELELLPGVGPALAARIVEYRREHGPFGSIEELDLVRGIGPRTLEAIRPLVTVK